MKGGPRAAARARGRSNAEWASDDVCARVLVAPDEGIGMQIGVISDTHGLVRPEAISALTGSDLIRSMRRAVML